MTPTFVSSSANHETAKSDPTRSLHIDMQVFSEVISTNGRTILPCRHKRQQAF